MYMQEKESVYDLIWNDKITYGDVHKKGEWELSVYNFEMADVDMLLKLFEMYERESLKLSEKGIVLPAYDYCLKCSHTFNILEARGAISVNERTKYIDRIRQLARKAARNYLAQREEMEFPLLKSTV
jgi:glycyl-tRNA synthetase alpha chain